MEGDLVPAYPNIPRPRLLGGSSKLARLAEERRKKAAAQQLPPAAPAGALSSLDRLSKSKDVKENVEPAVQPAPRKYPIRQKREPTPPPKEPSPVPEEQKEELPDLRASPTMFGKTLSTSLPQAERQILAFDDLFKSSSAGDAFAGPSPDDAVLRAQQHSKGLSK